MELSEIWLWYCGERFPFEEELPPPEPISPFGALELLFDLHPMFTARYDAIKLTPYNTAFDGEADGALAHMARFNSFDAWNTMTAGAWRVMNDRLAYAEVVLCANEAQSNPVIAHLPVGLDRESQARALMLMYLLGGARTIDRRLLASRPDGLPPELPSQLPLQRH